MDIKTAPQKASREPRPDCPFDTRRRTMSYDVVCLQGWAVISIESGEQQKF